MKNNKKEAIKVITSKIYEVLEYKIFNFFSVYFHHIIFLYDEKRNKTFNRNRINL